MFSEQELDNAITIMVEQLEAELQQNIIYFKVIKKTATEIAFDIGITNDSLPEELLNMSIWQLISFNCESWDENEYRYRVSCEGVAVIAKYVKQAYDRACKWLNEADFTATLHGKKNNWISCYEGLGEIRHDARFISEFQRGLRFYQHQVSELEEFYPGLDGDDLRKKDVAEAFRKVAQKLDQAFKDSVKPLGRKEDVEIKKHLKHHEDYKNYKHSGVFMLFIINYEMVRAAFSKKKEFPEKVVIRKSHLILHYSSSDEDEQQQTAPKVQSTKTQVSVITQLTKPSGDLDSEPVRSQHPSLENQLQSFNSEHFSQKEITNYQEENTFFPQEEKQNEQESVSNNHSVSPSFQMGAQPLEYENLPFETTPDKDQDQENDGPDKKRQRIYSPTQFGLSKGVVKDSSKNKSSKEPSADKDDDSQNSCVI